MRLHALEAQYAGDDLNQSIQIYAIMVEYLKNMLGQLQPNFSKNTEILDFGTAK
jgi:hypothetical protein